MILAPGAPDAPVRRLVARLASRGIVPSRADDEILVVGARTAAAEGGLEALFSGHPRARLLLLSALGTHPDAEAGRLRNLWAIEERARASGLPALTLRLGPLVGPDSPLWLRLRSRPRLPYGGRSLLQPVAEDDVLDGLQRAVEGRAEWSGWFEVIGPESLALGEIAELAAGTPRLPRGAGDWEPPPREWRDHRLTEWESWSAHFQLVPRSVSEHAGRWT